MNSKIILLTILAAQLCSYNWAQVFSGNLIGGVSSSQISGDGTEGFVQFGAYAGIGVEATIYENWSLYGNLMFNQKGARVYKSSNSIKTYRLRVNYIEVPVMLGYDYQKFSGQLGPYLGVKINQKEQTEFGVTENPREFELFDFGVQAQLSYQLKERLKLTLTFQNSILPVRAHDSQMAFSPSNFVLGDFHQELLDKGQYFTSLMLFASFQLGK